MDTHTSLFRVTAREPRLLRFAGIDGVLAEGREARAKLVENLPDDLKQKLLQDIDSVTPEELRNALIQSRERILATYNERSKEIAGDLHQLRIRAQEFGDRPIWSRDRNKPRVKDGARGEQIKEQYRAQSADDKSIVERLKTFPTREEVKVILLRLKKEAEQNQKTKREATEQKLKRSPLPSEAKTNIKKLPANVQDVAVDAFALYPGAVEILNKHPAELKWVLMDRGAMTMLMDCLKEDHAMPDAGDTSDAAKAVRTIIGDLSIPERKELLQFVTRLKQQSGDALNKPHEWGMTPEKMEEHIQERIKLLRAAVTNHEQVKAKIPSPLPDDPTLMAAEGEILIQKGLLMMAGVDVPVLESGTWQGLKDLPDGDKPKMVAKNEPGADLMKVGGLLLWCMGMCQKMGNMANWVKNQQNPPVPPENLKPKTNKELSEAIKSAEDQEKAIFTAAGLALPAPVAPVPGTASTPWGRTPLSTALETERGKLIKNPPPDDAARTTISANIEKLKDALKKFDALSAKLTALYQERAERETAFDGANTFLNPKGITLVREAVAPFNLVLTFDPTKYANPWGKGDGKKIFAGDPTVSWDDVAKKVTIGTTCTVEPDAARKDFTVTEGGKPAIVYETDLALNTVAAYEAASAGPGGDKAFMRATLAVRNDESAYANAIGLDHSRLGYSPMACTKLGMVTSTLALGKTDLPSCAADAIKTHPDLPAYIAKGQEVLQYQSSFDKLSGLTEGKVRVCCWSKSPRTKPKMDALVAKIDAAAVDPNVLNFKNQAKYEKITDSKIGLGPEQSYAHSKQIVWITDDAKIDRLMAAIADVLR